MPKQTPEPGAGRSSADAAFDELRREIAKRNELAQQKARKIDFRVVTMSVRLS